MITDIHDDVIKWNHFPRYWPFVRGIHRSPVNSLHKGQWRGALMVSLIYVWINGWVNNREAGDLRRYRAHYDVIVMFCVVEINCFICVCYNNGCCVCFQYHGWPSTQPGTCTQPCPIVHTAVPPLFTQPCPGRTMSTAVCIYVAGLCASCPAV